MSTASGYMMYYRILNIIIGLCSLLLISTHAQPLSDKNESNHPGWKDSGLLFIQNFGPNDYHARSQNWDLAQAPNGLIYVANSSGVLEYDGVSWRLISLPGHLFTYSVAVDHQGQVFVGGNNELGYLKPDSIGQMRYYSLMPYLAAQDRETDIITDICLKDDRVYFVGRKRIICWNRPDIGEIPGTAKPNLRIWKSKSSFFAGFLVRDKLYIRQGEGLFMLTGDSLQRCPNQAAIAGKKVMVMLPYPNGKDILVGTLANGLYLYDGSAFRPFPTEADAFFRENKKLYYDGAVLNDGSFALGSTTGGLVIIDQYGHFIKHITKESGLRNNSIFTCFNDKEGGLWLGTGLGIARVEYPSPITIFPEGRGFEGPVLDIARYNGDIYLLTLYNIYRQNTSPSNNISQIFTPLSRSPLEGFRLLSTGKSLLCGATEGIFEIQERDNLRRVSKSTVYTLEQSKIDTNLVYIGMSSDKKLGILRFVNGRWNYAGEIPIQKKEVSYLFEAGVESTSDPENIHLWLGGFFEGVLQLQISRKQLAAGNFEQALLKSRKYNLRDGLPGSFINMFSLGDKNFFATEKGLRIYDPESGKFVVETGMGAVLADTTVSLLRVVKIPEERIWLLRNSYRGREIGYASADKDGHFTWSTHPFARIGEYRINQVYADPQYPGVTWFGCDEGLLRYDENIAKNYSARSPTLIRSVLVNGDSLVFAGAGQDTAALSGPLILKHADNTLRFEFAVPSYDDPSKSLYQTFLEGFDRRWSKWRRENYIDYTNIPGGEYRFRVRSKNVYGSISREGAFSFKILPPWYLAWWAYLVYAVFIVLGIWALVKFRSRQLEQKAEALESIIHQRTEEIELKSEQLAKQAEQLKVLDKMKTRFFANISHEFRTPLTLILGPLQDIYDQTTEDNTRRKIPIVMKNARRLLQLVNQILDISKLEAGGMELKVSEHNIVPFLKGILFSFNSLAENRDISLNFHSESGTILMYFEPEKLEKIFNNLISNALKFTPEWGEVSVTVERVSEHVEQKLPVETDNKYSHANIQPLKSSPHQFVKICVTDNGVGIPPDQLPFVFDRFYQVDASSTRVQTGTGIGLALVKELTEIHGGVITVNSEPGKGSEFILTFPAGKAHFKPEQIVDAVEQPFQPAATPENDFSEGEAPAATDEALQESDADATIILIVEDHPDVRMYVQQYLAEDYRVVTSSNGTEGLKTARQVVPDLVISDVMMPKMNGFELCERLKTDEKTSHIPVILLTAKAGEENKLRGLETGADDYLTKPFSSKELKARVKNLIELRRRLRRQLSSETMQKPAKAKIGKIDLDFLDRIQKVVEKHIGDESFSVEQLGREVGMDRTQIHRKLRALLDQSASQFILTQRMNRAAELLKEGAGNIAEIAFQVGFGDPSYFTKCFRKQFGVAPSAFLKNR